MPTSRLKNALQIGSAALLTFATGTSMYVVGNTVMQGDTRITGTVQVGSLTQSGGLVALRRDLSGSGQFAIQNPTSVPLKCTAPTINVTTAASPATRVDIDVAVAGNSGVPQNSTGSLFNDVILSSTGLKTATGSAVSTADGQVYFRLDAAGGIYDYIYSRGTTGTGQGLVGSFHTECYRLR